MSTFLNGLLTGFFFQLAVGPVFFFIVNTALQKTMLDGILATIGVTLGDYLCIALAILGAGSILKRKKINTIAGIIGAVVLIIFGIFIIKNTDFSQETSKEIINTTSIYSSFISAFLLTIGSPLTVVFWTGLFTTKATEANYTKKQLIIFGLACGLSTILFSGAVSIILSLTKTSIPKIIVIILNLVVGITLIGYGIIRFSKTLLTQKK